MCVYVYVVFFNGNLLVLAVYLFCTRLFYIRTYHEVLTIFEYGYVYNFMSPSLYAVMLSKRNKILWASLNEESIKRIVTLC